MKKVCLEQAYFKENKCLLCLFVMLFVMVMHVQLCELVSPGLAILRRMATGSLRFHFWISSSILLTLAGLRDQRQPFPELPCFTSTFWKHLFRDRLCLTEFFQPSGAVCREGTYHISYILHIVYCISNVYVVFNILYINHVRYPKFRPW